MALKHVSVLFLFALFLVSFNEIQARDSQMFNKIPSKTNEVVVEQQNLPNKEATEPSYKPDPQQQDEPNVVTQSNENSYGLYGHETTTNNNNQKFETNPNSNPQNNFPYNAKYLPKNYNTVSYVTQPEDFNDNSYTTTSTNNNNYQTEDNSKSYYNAQKKDVTNEFDFMDNEDNEDNEHTSVADNTDKYYNSEAYNNNNNRNSYYNNGNNFNTRFVETTNNNNNNNGNSYFNNDVVSNNNDNNFNTRFMDVHETSDNNNNGNSYYNNNDNFNTRFTDIPETSNNNNNYYNSGKSRVVEPQGMSDTRFVENGRYHYDINTGKYSLDHPYMNPMAMRTQYNPNSYQYNNYNQEDQYQNEDNMP